MNYERKGDYINGVLVYSTDVTKPWDGAFEHNIRTVISPEPRLYIIIDDVKAAPGIDSCFILNTYAKISKIEDSFIFTLDEVNMAVIPMYEPDKSEFGEFGADGIGKPVNRLCIFDKNTDKKLVTVLEVFEKEPVYDKSRIEISANGIEIDGKMICDL